MSKSKTRLLGRTESLSVLGVTGQEFDELVNRGKLVPGEKDGRVVFEEDKLVRVKKYIRDKSKDRSGSFSLVDALTDVVFIEGLDQVVDVIKESVSDILDP